MKSSMSKPPVCFPVEVKSRDFLGRLLLAFHFVENGFPVLFGDKMGVYRELKYLENPVYLAKGGTSDYECVFKKVKTQGGINAVLSEEGAFNTIKGFELQFLKSFYPEKMMPYTDMIFSYGESFYSYLKENLPGSFRGEVFVSGNPRFDLHKEKYKGLFSEKINNITERYGEFILFDTNFGIANNVAGFNLIRSQIEESDDFSPEMKKFFIGRKVSQDKILPLWLAMIEKVAKTFSDVQIVVRPHPVENAETYKNAFSDIPNITVTTGGEAAPWIHAAKILVHHDCTTGIEGSFSKIPILSYTPVKDYDFFWLALKVSDSSSNEDELLNKIQKYLCSSEEFMLEEDCVESAEHEIANYKEYSDRLIVKSVQEMIDKKIGNKLIDLEPSFLKRVLRTIERIKDIPRQFLIKHVLASDYYLKCSGLEEVEITSVFEKLFSIEKVRFEYSIKKCGSNTYLLQRK